MVWRGATGWQVEVTVNFGPNVMSFSANIKGKTMVRCRGICAPPNNVPAVIHMEQAQKAAPKGLEIILMGDLNVQPRDPRDNNEEDLETALADRDMFSMTDHVVPQWWYRGEEIWTWRMQREGRQVTGRGEYALSADMCNFTNTGMGESLHSTDHMMILAVEQG